MNTTIMTTDCCNRCKFCKGVSEQVAPGKVENRLACMRFPPETLIIPQMKGIIVKSSYPIVNTDGWCGEFIPRIEMARN